MKHYIMAVFMICCCLLATLSFAADQNPKSMSALIALGLETNLGLQIEVIEVAKGAAEIQAEESAFDSTLFAMTGYGYSSTPYESSFSPSTKNNSEKISGQVGISKRFKTGLTTSLSLDSEWVSDNDLSHNLDPRYRTALFLDLNQPLLRNLGLAVNTTRLQISRNRQRQTSLTYLLKAQNLTLQLESAARGLAAKTEIIKLRQEALDLAKNLHSANKKRFEAGVIPVTEVQEAETALAARQLSLSLALQNRDFLLEDLNRQLDHRLDKEFEPAVLVDYNRDIESIKLPDFNQLFELAQQNRLELKINNYVVESSLIQQDYFQNQLKPQLDLTFQVGINGLSGDERNSAFESQYSGDWTDSFSSMGEVDGYQWRAGLEFSVPIGNRLAKARYRQSEMQLKQDRYRQRDLQAVIENDLLQQQVNIFHTKEQLGITKHFESLAEKTLQQEQRRLEEGLSDTFRIIVFQQKMIAAKIDRINAITRYHLALAHMQFALGQIFERHNIILTNHAEELDLENI